MRVKPLRLEAASMKDPQSTPRQGLPITVRRLTRLYGSFCALDAVNLDIKAGEFLSLLGPSGSGKTTLLMILAGFTRPSSGSVTFGALEVTRLAPHKRNIGVVFQNYALFPHMNVGENIAYPLRLRRMGSAAIAKKVERTLGQVDLAGMADRSIESLSGGQKQRVALARAIVFEPPVLLMDEPLSALDKKLREQLQLEIRNLHKVLGITTVYVTHDQREALVMSDRIAVINRGRVEQIGPPRAIYDNPASRFVAEFIGDAALVAAQFLDGAVLYEGQRFKVAQPPPGLNGRCFLVLRPERLSIVTQPVDPERTNIFRGRLDDVIYQGDSVLVSLRLPGGKTLTTRVMNARAGGNLPSTGVDVAVAIAVEDTQVVPGEE